MFKSFFEMLFKTHASWPLQYREIDEEIARAKSVLNAAREIAGKSEDNLYGSLGRDHAKALLPGLKTQIFHQNACIETNKYASETIGQRWVTRVTEGSGQSWGGRIDHYNQNQSENKSRVREPWLQPEDFNFLKSGGDENDFEVEGYVFKVGKKFRNGRPYYKATFTQARS